MLSEHEKLDALTVLGVELNMVQDLDILMERILSEARRFVNADAGSIYISHNDRLHFSYTQNDTLRKRLPKGGKLIYSTFTIPIDEKSIAGYVAASGHTLNIPDVYNLDPLKPYGFNKKFDETSHYKTKSALTVPLKTFKGEIIGILQIINAMDEKERFSEFSQSDEKSMTHFANIASVALRRAQMTRAMILRMIKMAEMRDPKETGPHVNRVGGYSVEIFEKWAIKNNYPENKIEKTKDTLRIAAMLHDVGKIAISDKILQKPGLFNSSEYEIMKCHTIYGARLFQDRQSDFDDIAAQVALNHHEWWNGDGYPGQIDVMGKSPENGIKKMKGKRGEEIPLCGRIVALADVYDALSSQRAYKDAWDEKKVLAAIDQGSGTQFDPKIVEIFFESLDIIKSIKARYKETMPECL